MKNKKVAYVLTVFMGVLTGVSLILGICAQPSQASGPPPEVIPKSFRIVAGPVGGSYNLWASSLAKLWEKKLGMAVTVSPGAHKERHILVSTKKIEAACLASTHTLAGYRGLKKYGWKEPVKTIRVLFHFYPAAYPFVALRSSGLERVSDLKGKRVGAGPAAPVWDPMCSIALSGQGLDYFKDIKRVYASFSDMATMVGDGRLDACVSLVQGFLGIPALTRLMEEKDVVFLKFDPAGVGKAKGAVVGPPIVIKKGTLGLKEDYPCHNAGTAGFHVHEDMDQRLVYWLVKLMYENLGEMAKDVPYLRYPLENQEQLTEDLGYPYHPGAIKYWKEVGLWKR